MDRVGTSSTTALGFACGILTRQYCEKHGMNVNPTCSDVWNDAGSYDVSGIRSIGASHSRSPNRENTLSRRKCGCV
jgi:hypothetical protein